MPSVTVPWWTRVTAVFAAPELLIDVKAMLPRSSGGVMLKPSVSDVLYEVANTVASRCLSETRSSSGRHC